jgi:hypothetical protein
MARQDSNSELAGSLGASLTPRVEHLPLTPRGVQSSGLFDMGALYAEALDQVMARARAQTRLMPLARAAQVTLPRAAPWPARGRPFDLDAPIDFSRAFAAPRAVGLGWFGVAIAWLATVTTAALVAVALPAHTRAAPRAHAGTIVVVVPATHPSVVEPVAPAAPAGADSAIVPAAMLTVPTTATTTPATTTPLATASSSPLVIRASSAVAGPPVTSRPSLATKRPASKAAGVTLAHARPAPSAPSAPPPTASAIAASPPVKSTTTRPEPAATPASGMSLEDLIRHEVQAESSKHH